MFTSPGDLIPPIFATRLESAALSGRIRLIVLVILTAACVTQGRYAAKAEAFTIVDAISQAVQTNPGVREAAANRRTTDAEFHQSQSALLPQVRLDASSGPQRFNQQDMVPLRLATPNG